MIGNIKERWWELAKALIILALGFSAVIGTALLSNLFEKPAEVVVVTPDGEVTRPPLVSCPADFRAYQALENDDRSVVNLVEEKISMYAEDGEFRSKVVVTKVETEKSKVACGYLHVRAGTETYGPLQSWENLYINPNSFGGHINPENNIGSGDSSSYSDYVFPLSKIRYWRTRNDRVQGNLLTADWGVLLNVSQTIEFEIGLNTNDQTGFLDAFSIAYKCWNPATGEQNYECSIEILE